MSKDEEFEKLKSEVIEFKHQIEMRTSDHEFSIHKHISEYESEVTDKVNDLKMLISNGLSAGLFAIFLIFLAVSLTNFFPDLF